MESPATIVLVHGATLGAWAWDSLTEELTRRGVKSVAVDLPSCGPTPNGLRGLRADALHVRQQIDSIEGPVVVCGHSYGGAPMTEGAAEHLRVRHLVYLAAFMLDGGESTSAAFSEVPSPASQPPFEIRGDGTFCVNRAVAGEFLGDVPPAVASTLDARSGYQSVASIMALPTAIAWKTIPSTYLVALRDALVAPATQERFARRATTRVECDSNHFPQFAQPRFVADLLERIAKGRV